jgi:hypothetical protein
MKLSIIAMSLSALIAFGAAGASVPTGTQATPAPPPPPTQSGALNAPSGAGTMSPKAPQQDRMKGCNADANKKNLTGATRKTFMSDCLKKK